MLRLPIGMLPSHGLDDGLIVHLILQPGWPRETLRLGSEPPLPLLSRVWLVPFCEVTSCDNLEVLQTPFDFVECTLLVLSLLISEDRGD